MSRHATAKRNDSARATFARLGFSAEDLAIDYVSSPKIVLRAVAQALEEEYARLMVSEMPLFDREMGDLVHDTFDAVIEHSVLNYAHVFRLAGQQTETPSVLRDILSSVADTLEALTRG